MHDFMPIFDHESTQGLLKSSMRCFDDAMLCDTAVSIVFSYGLVTTILCVVGGDVEIPI